jgi:uncharacterized protein YbjT (DUF2867 family)
MRVLVCGARGFIGARVAVALQQAGHEVLRGVRTPAMGRADERQVDFVHWRQPEPWRTALTGADAVINTVGVLRDSRQQPMQAIHAEAPEALFEACARQGVRRVIHVSALGIEGNPTLYARSKLAAEAALLDRVQAGRLDGVVLRPSIVFGEGGDSSRLFTLLARLPLLCLPSPVMRAQVQPIAVGELAQGVSRLLAPEGTGVQGLLNVVGPQPLTLAEFIASLRRQMGHGGARVLPLPDLLTRWSARLGDELPWAPWCTETLSLLAQDNVAAASAFEQLLGRAATAPDHLLACAP